MLPNTDRRITRQQYTRLLTYLTRAEVSLSWLDGELIRLFGHPLATIDYQTARGLDDILGAWAARKEQSRGTR